MTKRNYKYPHNLSCYMSELMEEYGKVMAACDAYESLGKSNEATSEDFQRAKDERENARRVFFMRFDRYRLRAMSEACEGTLRLLDE